jgi:hypothetical protein
MNDEAKTYYKPYLLKMDTRTVRRASKMHCPFNMHQKTYYEVYKLTD